ncbi:biopolymer transporter Tol [Frigoribacterium sp. SL97]|uniref:biopolymer transporter Tol n=1 Tax=Frigoribacterium sp. SL97 TaxID=2994664 RepID=UPI002270FB49|nr:biopolymer transporter Tol [Frigoribacterium sp. SL97]WAC51347.1 biopolymer transporter Tol [Frigoribacterium sp. SL97]
MSAEPLVTPDGRYLVVRGRLWRRTDPRLDEATRASLVHDLMEARRAKKTALAADDAAAVEDARARVDAAKTLLGERGPVWCDDDAPDETRRMARNTRYADWFATVGPDAATN